MSESPKNNFIIIEDEVLVARDMSLVLSSMGYECKGIFTNGAEAIACHEKDPVDLAICDINIKGEFDGIETARKLVKIQKLSIIYLTAYSDNETVSRALATLPATYLLKPYNERNLKISVKLAFAKSEKISQVPPNEEYVKLFSPRELEVLRFLAEGKRSQEIADQLFISRLTVEKHRANMLHKSQLNNVVELINFATDNGLI